jgi:hypothetical protein
MKWLLSLLAATGIVAATAAQADTTLLNVIAAERAAKIYGRTPQLKPTPKWDRFVWTCFSVGFVWVALAYLFFDRLVTYLVRVL